MIQVHINSGQYDSEELKYLSDILLLYDSHVEFIVQSKLNLLSPVPADVENIKY